MPIAEVAFAFRRSRNPNTSATLRNTGREDAPVNREFGYLLNTADEALSEFLQEHAAAVLSK